jgi:hypothetical protein
MEAGNMDSGGIVPFERDCALVEAMRLVGEPVGVIEDFLMCLDISEFEREELRRVAQRVPSADMTSGDVIEMNPLTSQPQRSKPRP